VQQSKFAYLLPSVAHLKFEETEIDLLHANHIEVFDGSQVGISPLFAEGNMLISMKSLNAIAIIDGEALEIVWLWGPTNIALQHHPRLLEGGRILLFDNGIEASRVIELDPLTGRIEWYYEDGESFFSFWGGANQRLPNGNTLVTQTDGGYSFEVTPSKDVVWKFANPEVENDFRKNIWRMTRHIPTDLEFID
jgi:hypothetical protein